MKKPIYKKWWFWLIIAVVLIIIISGSGNSDNSDDGDVTNNNSNGTTTNNSSGNVYGVGDTLTTSKLKITFQKVEVWSGYNQYSPPKDGYKILRAYFVIENISSSDEGVGSWDFDCYADGLAVDEYYFGDDALAGFDSISAGRKMQGYLYYEVPVNSNKIEIEYETNSWTSDKVIFEVDLSK